MMFTLKKKPVWLDGSFVFYLLTTLALIVIGYTLVFLGPDNVTVPQAAMSHILLHSDAPDPILKDGDRAVYFGLIFLLPLVLIGAALIARKKTLVINEITLVPIIVAISIAAVLWRGDIFNIYGLTYAGITTVTGFFLFRYLPSLERRRDLIVWGGIVAVIFLGYGLRLWTAHSIEYRGPFYSHYEAAAYSIMHIAAGGTCHADAVVQYGCYGEFLAPILKLFGSTTLTITATFATLMIAATSSAIFYAHKIIRTPALLLSAILCLICMTALFMRAYNNDPTPQYYPLRYLFPALSLSVFYWIRQSPTYLRVLAAGLFSGMAIAWNIESGLAVCIALGLFIAIGDLNAPSWNNLRSFLQGIARGLTFVTASLIFLSLFALYLQVKSGGTINPSNIMAYQQTFYFTGFAMIVFPGFPDYWTIHAAAIVAVLLLTSLYIGTGRQVDVALERAAFLAILAIGITLYYSGRSHPMVLKLIAWPSAILLPFLIERMLAAMQWRDITRRSILVLSIALPTGFILINAPFFVKMIFASRIASAQATPVEEDIAFVRSHVTPGETVAILALNQTTLYGETGTKPGVPGPGVAEVLRLDTLNQIQNDLIKNGPEKLFMGVGLDKIETGTGIEIPFDFNAIQKVYKRIERSPSGRLIYFERMGNR